MKKAVACLFEIFFKKKAGPWVGLPEVSSIL
jgi:hypothetical protein